MTKPSRSANGATPSRLNKNTQPCSETTHHHLSVQYLPKQRHLHWLLNKNCPRNLVTNHDKANYIILHWVSGGHQTDRWKHIHEIVEEPPQQHFKGDNSVSSSKTRSNMTSISMVITLWVSLTMYQTITFIMNSSDKLPWLSTDVISSWLWV